MGEPPLVPTVPPTLLALYLAEFCRSVATSAWVLRRLRAASAVLAMAAPVRVVVPPVAVPVDEFAEKRANVVEQRLLCLVDEERERRVRRSDEGDPVADARASHPGLDPRHDVDELQPLVRVQAHQVGVNLAQRLHGDLLRVDQVL